MPRKKTVKKGRKKDRLAAVNLYDDDTPDLEDDTVLHDEIDQFVNSKNKADLSTAKKKLLKRKGKLGPKEVFPLNSDDSDDEDVGADDVDSEFDSDVEERKEGDYLPSADAWGKKREAFYNTDYVDKDYGGFSDESDEERAALEEMEADSMQKRIIEHTTIDDYALPQASTSTKSQKKGSEKQETPVGLKDVNLELDTPELRQMYADMMEKQHFLETKLQPVLKLIEDKKLPDLAAFNVIKQQTTVYASYCLNLQFYFYLLSKKGGHSIAQANAHPVLDKIIQWKKLMTKLDVMCAPILPNIEQILDQLNTSELLRENLEGLGQKEGMEEGVDELDQEEGQMDAEDEDGKRPIGYTIAKNKGLLPKRKREQRNPRVKHKNKFRKAQIKRKSQVPDVKRELKKYSGEARGIKTHVVKSIKLS